MLKQLCCADRDDNVLSLARRAAEHAAGERSQLQTAHNWPGERSQENLWRKFALQTGGGLTTPFPSAQTRPPKAGTVATGHRRRTRPAAASLSAAGRRRRRSHLPLRAAGRPVRGSPRCTAQGQHGRGPGRPQHV